MKKIVGQYQIFEAVLYSGVHSLNISKYLREFGKRRSTITKLQNSNNFHTSEQIDRRYSQFQSLWPLLLQKFKSFGFNNAITSFSNHIWWIIDSNESYNNCKTYHYYSTSGVPRRSHLGFLFFKEYSHSKMDNFW